MATEIEEYHSSMSDSLISLGDSATTSSANTVDIGSDVDGAVGLGSDGDGDGGSNGGDCGRGGQ